YTFRTDAKNPYLLIEAVNGTNGDSYVVISYNNVCSQGLGVDLIEWQLDDPTGKALTNDFLLTTPAVLSAWEEIFGLAIEGACSAYRLGGQVVSISEAPPIFSERPKLEVGKAVEIRWSSQWGYYYQIQRSEDLTNWTNVGDPVLGDG